MKTTLLSMLVLAAMWTANAQNPILGTWTGTYGNGASQTGFFYSLQFNGDGTMKVLQQDGNTLASGNCTINGNSVTGTYYYSGNQPYSITGAYNSANNTMTGTWGAGSNTTGGGAWIMTTKKGGPPVTASQPIPFTRSGSLTKASATTTTPAASQPIKAMPVASTGMVITGTVNVLSNATYTSVMPDGTRVNTTFRPNASAPSTFGGQVRENIVSTSPVQSNGSWDGTTVTKTVTSSSDNFLNTEYNSMSAYIYPGAIYTFDDFMKGNRSRAFESGRNPIEIGTDKTGGGAGATYRTVNTPTQNTITDVINQLRNTFSEGGSSIKYRVYSSDNDAELSINAAAGGNFAGFKASANYSMNTTDKYYYITIDATKAFFTMHTNIPVNGYFADKSIEQNNKNMIVLKNVVYGCRVLANVRVNANVKKEDIGAQFAYGGVGEEALAQGVFAFAKKGSNVESTVNAYIVGGPGGATTFQASKLEEQINSMIAQTSFSTAQPIAYTFTDINGNILGIESATDTYTTPECKPKNAVYRLSGATVKIMTGTDPKNQGSNAEFDLFNSGNVMVYTSNQNNIEFPTGPGNEINLSPLTNAAAYASLDAFKSGGYLDVFFTPIQIAFGHDEWNIKGATVRLTFVDQNNVPMKPIQIEYNNLNIWMKLNEQRLRLPFTFNGSDFVGGGAFMPR